MAIKKRRTSESFTIIPNETLQDTSLSFEAKGLLSIILSLPDDWIIRKEWMRKQCPSCGRDRLDRILKELQQVGYMTKELKHDENGKLAGYDWIIYDLKQPQASDSKTSTGALKTRTPANTDDGKPEATKKHIYKETTTGETKSKVLLSEFSDLVTDQMQGSGVPDWFVLNYAHDLYEQYKTPRVAMAVKIIWQDWNSSERKTIGNVEVQQAQGVD